MSRYNQNPIYVEHKMDREFDAAMKSGDRKRIEQAGKGVEFELKCYKLIFFLLAPLLFLIGAGCVWIIVSLVQTFGPIALIFNPVTTFIGIIYTLAHM